MKGYQGGRTQDNLTFKYEPEDDPVIRQILDHGTSRLTTNDGKVTWHQDTAGQDQVWIWDGTPCQVTTEPVDHQRPAMGDDTIIYEKWSSGGLFGWDLATDTEFLVANITSPDEWRMDGNVVVWAYNDSLYYAYVNQADLSVSEADVVMSTS